MVIHLIDINLSLANQTIMQVFDHIKKSKKLQITSALVLTHIILVFGYFIPTEEEISYFESKLTGLKNDYRIQKNLSRYLDSHKERIGPIQLKLKKLKRYWNQKNDFQQLQKQLNRGRITVISQRVTPLNQQIPEQIVKQTISGKYQELTQYFETVLSENNPVILSFLSIKNQTPVSKNPKLEAELELRFFKEPK